jgi:hypothetical protein
VWASRDEILTIPSWFQNRGDQITDTVGEILYHNTFVGLNLETFSGPLASTVRFGGTRASPIFAEVVKPTATGRLIKIPESLQATRTTEAEDWGLYVTSPAIKWEAAKGAKFLPSPHRHDMVVVPVSVKKVDIIASLRHYGAAPRYTFSKLLANALGEATAEDDVMLCDAAVGLFSGVGDMVLHEDVGGYGTLTFFARDEEMH